MPSVVKPLAIDVTDDESMVAGITRIIEEQGRLDLLVNNAGCGSYGALEDVSMEEARRRFEVNVFGAVRLMQLAFPHMREQRRGRIINITSMGDTCRRIATASASQSEPSSHSHRGR